MALQAGHGQTPAVTVTGVVYDKATSLGIPASIEIQAPPSAPTSIDTRPDGSYRLELPPNRKVKLIITAKQYRPVTNQFSTYTSSLVKHYYLIPIINTKPSAQPAYPAGAPFMLQNLLFVTSSTRLMGRSMKELKALADYLRQHPGTTLLIEGHTDRVGNSDMNQKLSEQRAEKIKEFLVGAGIAANRITTAGYGDTNTLCPPPCPDNRRVEFTITE